MNQKRYELLRAMGCIACRIAHQSDCGPVEIHHLNLGGFAGQKRRGDEFTIPLGLWHHQGRSHWGHSPTLMVATFGPSLKFQSRAFRATYGSDDQLLAEVERRLASMTADQGVY